MTVVRAHLRGFTLLELLIVIIAGTLIGTALLNRLHSYQELAERAAMESTVRLIRTGLQLRLAELIVANRQGEAAQLEAEDPTRWYRPANFAGPYRQPLEPGNWYYDANRRQLVYVVHLGERLVIENAGGTRELRFQARLLKDRLVIGGAPVESVTSVTVVPVTPFRWSRAEAPTILA